MNHIRIKICGITRPQDALLASKLGADAIGLVFYAGSKRAVNLAQAQKIVQQLPPFVTVVALFVNEQASVIEHILQNLPIDVLQFHGDETPEFCQQFARPYIKAIRVRDTADVVQADSVFGNARALLFDAYSEHAYGGTGQTFDWEKLPTVSLRQPWVLAGGLTPENVAQAIHISQAQAVDVSGGVESGAGVKDAEKMRAFIQAVRCDKMAQLPDRI